MVVSPESMPSAVAGTTFAAVQGDEALHRTHELHVGAVGPLVGHDLRNRQLGERFIERRLQAVGERRARRRVAQEERFGLAVLGAFEFAQGKVGKAERGEFLGERRGGLAVLVERDRNRQHLLAHLSFRRDLAHVLDEHGEAARRREFFEARLAVDQIACGETLHDAFRKRGPEARERFRRQFFGEQFDEQGGLVGLRHCSFVSRQTWSRLRSTFDGGAQAGMAASCSSVVRPAAGWTGLPSIGKPSASRDS